MSSSGGSTARSGGSQGGSKVRRFAGSQVRRFQFAGSHAGSQVRIPRISRQFRQFKPPLPEHHPLISASELNMSKFISDSEGHY